MDLMSSLRSLLLCALAALLPGALGLSSAQLQEIKWNNSLMINQKQLTHKILLNINGPPLVKVVSELQSVFRDNACRNCTTCMERAIKAHRVQSHIITNQPNLNELYYDVLNNNERRKRNTVVPNNLDKNIEKMKSVTATVTRYVKDRKVFAIEINEVNESDKSNICSIYSVKKSLPCDSGSAILSTTKKITKRHKKPKEISQVTLTTRKPKLVSSAYKKRQIDSSQVSETFSPSIEDMY